MGTSFRLLNLDIDLNEPIKSVDFFQIYNVLYDSIIVWNKLNGLFWDLVALNAIGELEFGQIILFMERLKNVVDVRLILEEVFIVQHQHLIL